LNSECAIYQFNLPQLVNFEASLHAMKS